MAQKVKLNTRKHLLRARRARDEERAAESKTFRLSPRWRKHQEEMKKMLDGCSGDMLIPEGEALWQR